MTNETSYNTCRFCRQTFGRHENSCPLNDQDANPDVYTVEDGHPYTPSSWPGLKGKCDLCTRIADLHLEVKP